MKVPDAPLRASLSLPAQASMIGTVRTFVERVASSRATSRSVDDLRVAVGEACASMRGPRLTVSLEITDGRCHVRCRGVVAPTDDDEDQMRRRLLTALAPDATWAPDDEVRFSLPLSA